MMVGTAACASLPGKEVRFENAPVAWKVDDRSDIPQPEERGYPRKTYHFTHVYFQPVLYTLEVPGPRRAMNINALREVPDSTWFTNRIGVREMTPREVARGPNTDDGPDTSGPWTILSSKPGGAQPGFLIEDSRGVRFLLKFDHPGKPEMETGADVVVARLLWASGYFVPEDTVVHFQRSDLKLAPDAHTKDRYGNEIPMTEAHLRDTLDLVHQRRDGSYRGLASKFLDGAPLGGYPQRGIRTDDPNDVIPHEHRREVRAQYVFFSWLHHTDVKEDNWLDMWVEDPEEPGRHYVIHYLVDFGLALGNVDWLAMPWDGYAHKFDFEYAPRSLLAFGLWKRPWEEIPHPGLRGVGRYESEHWQPDLYKTRMPFYPFRRLDRFDAFWAAKIIMKFTPAQIRAAVNEGKYSWPASEKYLAKTIVERQRKTGRFWFSKVNPLDEFSIEATPTGYRICASDLLVAYQFDAPSRAGYRAKAYDRDGRATGWRGKTGGTADGRLCFDGVQPGSEPDGYVFMSLVTSRGGVDLDPVWLHLARGPGGTLRIIGIHRV